MVAVRKIMDFANGQEYSNWIKENKYAINQRLREINTYEWNGGIRMEYIRLW